MHMHQTYTYNIYFIRTPKKEEDCGRERERDFAEKEGGKLGMGMNKRLTEELGLNSIALPSFLPSFETCPNFHFVNFLV